MFLISSDLVSVGPKERLIFLTDLYIYLSYVIKPSLEFKVGLTELTPSSLKIRHYICWVYTVEDST